MGEPFTKFNLLKYLDNFQQEQINTNPYEKQNKSRKDFFKKFYISSINLAQASSHYTQYSDYEASFKPISYDSYRMILKNSDYSLYYDQYVINIPITFAVEESLRTIGRKIKFTIGSDKYKFTNSTIDYMTYLVSAIIYDNIEVDNFGHNRFFKKKIAGKLLVELQSELNKKMCFNQFVVFTSEEQGTEFFTQLKIFTVKVL